MRVQTEDRPVEATGVLEESDFVIEMTPKLFEMWSDGLYSNKARAVLRELSANALDSHIAADKADVPFEVHLPTRLRPTLTIKDFGIGMTHDTVMKLYRSYGGSTKDGSVKSEDDPDVANGGFGMGSKSPFALSSDFTVISRRDGEMRVYSCFVSETGKPKIVLLDPGVIPTDEPNGVEVSVPVNDAMIYRIKAEAPSVFEFYETKPIVTGLLDPLPEKPEYGHSGPNWAVREKDDSRGPSRVVMGVYAYPIDTDQMGSVLSEDTLDFLINNRIDLFVDMGQVSLTPSRESLSYNERTTKVLTSVIVDAQEAIKAAAFKDIEAPGLSLWERSRIFTTWYEAVGRSVFSDPHYYPDRSAPIAVRSFNPLSTREIYSQSVGKTDFEKYKRPRMNPSRPVDMSRDQDQTVFVIDDLPHRSRQTTRIWHNFQFSGRTVHTFHARDDMSADELKARVFTHFGEFPADQMVMMSDLEAPARAAPKPRTRTGSLSSAQLREICDPSLFNFSRNGTERCSVQLFENEQLPEEAVYIMTSQGIATVGTSTLIEQAGRLLNLKVFLVPLSQKKKIPAGWVDLQTAIEKSRVVARKMINVKSEGRAAGFRQRISGDFVSWILSNPEKAEAYAASRKQGRLRQLVKKYLEVRSFDTPPNQDINLAEIRFAWDEAVQEGWDEAERMQKDVAREVPLLARQVLGSYWTKDEDLKTAAWDAV